MNDDCLDFFYCSMRRGTVLHYMNMYEWQSDIYKGNWVMRGCIKLLKTLKRLQNEFNSEEKIAEQEAAHKEFLESEEHKNWLVEWEKRDEDHNELRNDPDPKGWVQFLKVIKSPMMAFMQFVYEVCLAHPESGELQVKALDKFVLARKTEYAIVAACNIAKHHSRYHKSQRALGKFEAYLKKDADTSKLNAADAEKLKDF